MYGQTPRQRSVSLSPTVAPRLLAEEVSLSLEPVGDHRFPTPLTEQADAWACSLLLNLSPYQCDHTDNSCSCWQDDYGTLFPNELTDLSYNREPHVIGNRFASKALTESSSSSSGSGSAPSTNYERSSEVGTRATSLASTSMSMLLQTPSPALQTHTQSGQYTFLL